MILDIQQKAPNWVTALPTDNDSMMLNETDTHAATVLYCHGFFALQMMK